MRPQSKGLILLVGAAGINVEIGTGLRIEVLADLAETTVLGVEFFNDVSSDASVASAL